MKITQSTLRRIIKEEIAKAMSEGIDDIKVTPDMIDWIMDNVPADAEGKRWMDDRYLRWRGAPNMAKTRDDMVLVRGDKGYEFTQQFQKAFPKLDLRGRTDFYKALATAYYDKIDAAAPQ